MAKCTIKSKIGEGAFGTVYLLQIGRRQKYALKAVNTQRLNTDEEECCQEGTLMLKLCHDHLVHCFDAFLCGPHLCLVLELCIHGSLEDYLSKRNEWIPEQQICTWMVQMADVLRYLHALKVIHRDLKPANVFLDGEENIRLGDLGVARELDHTVQERQSRAGTLPYMSPEAFEGLPYNFKTDIWSMGCCIHEAMTLRKTFPGHSWRELYDMITSAKVPKMPTLYQRSLKRLVLSLLHVDSSQRPDALEILYTLVQIQGKKFSPGPCKIPDKFDIDHEEIWRAVKEFEMKPGNEAIKPLGATTDVGETHSNQKQNLTDSSNSYGMSREEDFFERDERESSLRQSTLMPRMRKKRQILTSLESTKVKNEFDNLQTEVLERKDTADKVDKDIPDRSSRLSDEPLDSSQTCSSSTHQTEVSSRFQGDFCFHGEESQRDNWPQHYIDTLARESIEWLRERFTPHSIQTKHTLDDNDNHNDEEEDDDDNDDVEEDDDIEEEEASGLVTLFTQAQTAVFIHAKTRHTPHKSKQSTQENAMREDLSPSVVEAARNTVDVFKGQDPHVMELLLIKVMGLRGFTLYGQAVME